MCFIFSDDIIIKYIFNLYHHVANVCLPLSLRLNMFLFDSFATI